MGMISDHLANYWVMYWPPIGVDAGGQTIVGAGVVFKGNWAETEARTQVVDGETFNVTNTVYSSRELLPGGILVRLSESLSTPAATVLATHIGDVPPPENKIASVSKLPDLDDASDIIYKASL